MFAVAVDGGFLFGELTPAMIDTLKGVPMLIESSDARVRDRLLPETCSDDEDEAHWRAHAVPELERLFLSRAQVVRRDLATVAQLPRSTNSMLLIPDEHVNAWLAALNAARLALYVLNDMTEEHMTEEGLRNATPKQQEAALRIELLAAMQGVLLGDFDEHPGDDDEGSDDDFDIDGLDDFVIG